MCIYIEKSIHTHIDVQARVGIKEGVYACMPWATESSDKFVIPAAHSFREDSQSVPSTYPVQLLGTNLDHQPNNK